MQVFLNDENITSTQCECPRGNYKCSHAAALMIHAIHNLGRTDVECSWKKDKKTADCISIEEMYPSNKTYNPLGRPVHEQDKKWLTEELDRYGRFTGLAWILSPEPNTATMPILTVEKILSSDEFLTQTDPNKKDFILEKMQIDEAAIMKVEDLTKGQRNNPQWLILRKWRLTASNFGIVLNSKKVTSSLYKRILGEYDLSGVQAINWGIVKEEEAIQAFQLSTGFVVESSGLWLDKSGILGASPDGLVGSDAVVEVKCPFSKRSCTIDEAVKCKDFCLIKNDTGLYELKKNHVYWHQIQGQIYISKRQKCYFVVWTPKEFITLVIEKDAQWAINLDKLKTFYCKYILEHLLQQD